MNLYFIKLEVTQTVAQVLYSKDADATIREPQGHATSPALILTAKSSLPILPFPANYKVP